MVVREEVGGEGTAYRGRGEGEDRGAVDGGGGAVYQDGWGAKL